MTFMWRQHLWLVYLYIIMWKVISVTGSRSDCHLQQLSLIQQRLSCVNCLNYTIKWNLNIHHVNTTFIPSEEKVKLDLKVLKMITISCTVVFSWRRVPLHIWRLNITIPKDAVKISSRIIGLVVQYANSILITENQI